jgi:nucleoid DNA-binding protein
VKVAERCRRLAGIMTKADLITVIADKLKFPSARAELLVDAVFGCMEQSMSRGEKIEIRGFGSFTVRQYRAYDGRNPRTGRRDSVKAEWRLFGLCTCCSFRRPLPLVHPLAQFPAHLEEGQTVGLDGNDCFSL